MSNKFSAQRKYQKALESLVYLSKQDTRLYWVLKAIYIADKEHLSKYGRQIFGDSYIAMENGPVPSLAYDITKSVRKDSNTYTFFEPSPDTALEIVSDNRTVKARADRKVDMDLFSDSEIQCLDIGYKVVKNLGFDELHKLTSDKAYESADLNGEMSLKDIVETVKNHEDVLDYMFNR